MPALVAGDVHAERPRSGLCASVRLHAGPSRDIPGEIRDLHEPHAGGVDGRPAIASGQADDGHDRASIDGLAQPRRLKRLRVRDRSCRSPGSARSPTTGRLASTSATPCEIAHRDQEGPVVPTTAKSAFQSCAGSTKKLYGVEPTERTRDGGLQRLPAPAAAMVRDVGRAERAT